MSEYVPHIDEVQAAYVDATQGPFNERLKRAKEFEAWLASVKEENYNEGYEEGAMDWR